MTEHPYSRQLNRPVRYFRFFSMIDLFVIVGGVIAVPQVLGFIGFIVAFAAYFTHLVIFRINRRAGYDTHFFRAMMRPRRFRAGRLERRQIVLRDHHEV